MNITLQKFGTTLTSRQAGKEAFAAFQQSLNGISDNEEVVVDFQGVVTFTPSWGDEFLTPLLERYGRRLSLINTQQNPSVRVTLEVLERFGKHRFKLTSLA